MRLLFLGGTGTISSACSELALARGHELWLLTRGRSARPAPAGARTLQADLADPGAVGRVLDGMRFDAVVDFICYEPAQLAARIALFTGRCGQYVLISSASVYRKPLMRWPLTEDHPLGNDFWDYARAKIACEDLLARSSGLPATVVRPSHTYDERTPPVRGGWAMVERLRRGAPVVVHGDGTSLWTLTHSRDFAVGLLGLLGLPAAIGVAVHITSDEAQPWDAIVRTLAAAAGVSRPRLVHVASERIASVDARWGASLLGDKAHCGLFDNARIRALVPAFRCRTGFARGAAEIIAWHDADPARRRGDAAYDAACDALAASA